MALRARKVLGAFEKWAPGAMCMLSLPGSQVDCR